MPLTSLLTINKRICTKKKLQSLFSFKRKYSICKKISSYPVKFKTMFSLVSLTHKHTHFLLWHLNEKPEHTEATITILFVKIVPLNASHIHTHTASNIHK